MTISVVESLYSDFDNLLSHLESTGEISFRSLADNNFKKNLILSSASFFETELCNTLTNYFEAKAPNCPEIKEFLVNKAVVRQYHTFFNWDGNNANTFFSLFGNGFKKFMNERLSSDNKLKQSISDFIELGRERNRLVHQNFGSYSVEKTAKEIFSLYISAKVFISNIESLLNEYNISQQNP
jgi:hypothetical protein